MDNQEIYEARKAIFFWPILWLIAIVVIPLPLIIICQPSKSGIITGLVALSPLLLLLGSYYWPIKLLGVTICGAIINLFYMTFQYNTQYQYQCYSSFFNLDEHWSYWVIPVSILLWLLWRGPHFWPMVSGISIWLFVVLLIGTGVGEMASMPNSWMAVGIMVSPYLAMTFYGWYELWLDPLGVPNEDVVEDPEQVRRELAHANRLRNERLRKGDAKRLKLEAARRKKEIAKGRERTAEEIIKDIVDARRKEADGRRSS